MWSVTLMSDIGVVVVVVIAGRTRIERAIPGATLTLPRGKVIYVRGSGKAAKTILGPWKSIYKRRRLAWTSGGVGLCCSSKERQSQ